MVTEVIRAASVGCILCGSPTRWTTWTQVAGKEKLWTSIPTVFQRSMPTMYMYMTYLYMLYTLTPASASLCRPRKPVQTAGYTMYIRCIYMHIHCIYMYIACTSAPNIKCMFHYGIFHCKLVCTASRKLYTVLSYRN